MPLYNYRCVKCGHVMEVLEKANTNSRHTCKKCGAHRVEKMLPAFSVNSGSGTAGNSCPTGTCSLS
ncbi:MAG: zinc ribbon domain-containing protein [Candidatus Hydrogenedentes bacterium]|nr:zinc ribbon domain-containing protein [Candidatus Hydrogenedentota bacterium]